MLCHQHVLYFYLRYVRITSFESTLLIPAVESRYEFCSYSNGCLCTFFRQQLHSGGKKLFYYVLGEAKGGKSYKWRMFISCRLFLNFWPILPVLLDVKEFRRPFKMCVCVFFSTDSNFVLGNAQVPHLYPIVYCSDGFCDLTGFPRAQIMQKGSACAFLYGPETRDEHKQEIERALQKKMEHKLEVMLYKKGGEKLNFSGLAKSGGPSSGVGLLPNGLYPNTRSGRTPRSCRKPFCESSFKSNEERTNSLHNFQ